MLDLRPSIGSEEKSNLDQRALNYLVSPRAPKIDQRGFGTIKKENRITIGNLHQISEVFDDYKVVFDVILGSR
jgi:hypothetical protein